MRTLRQLALASVAFLVAGCGGGGFGKETLYVSVSYANTSASLFTVSSLQPTLTGFDGHDARCDQESGVAPPGMHINNDCSISGRPTQAGTFTFRYKVRAENAEGSFSSSVTVSVAGPNAFYDNVNTTVQVGAVVSDAPRLSSWTAPTDGTVLTWNYSVTGGSLPPGLTLNATTGVISGTATSAGSYSATIQPMLSTVYGSYTAPVTSYARLVRTN